MKKCIPLHLGGKWQVQEPSLGPASSEPRAFPLCSVYPEHGGREHPSSSQSAFQSNARAVCTGHEGDACSLSVSPSRAGELARGTFQIPPGPRSTSAS